jgi:hypothetical protein
MRPPTPKIHFPAAGEVALECGTRRGVISLPPAMETRERGYRSAVLDMIHRQGRRQSGAVPTGSEVQNGKSARVVGGIVGA